jgi:predicted RNase H-like HicB family nuclease
MNKYQVVITRDGRWWMISVPEIDGLTQARRLADVEQMARELIAVTLDVRLSEVAVEVTFGDIDGIPVGSCIEAISSEKAEAARLEEDAAAKTKTLVKELVAHNVPLRDIGAMLGLSFQRVHQLAA